MPTAPVPVPSPGQIRLVSAIIVGALVLQFLAVVLRTGPWLYPFINYPMYATAHYEGDRIAYEHTVHARFADGSESAFKSADLTSLPFFFDYWVKAMAAMAEDPGIALAFLFGGIVTRILREGMLELDPPGIAVAVASFFP